MKTNELTGAGLDWAVAKALGYAASDLDLLYDIKSGDDFRPSTDWALGGPIIERERIALVYRNLGIESYWFADAFDHNRYISGGGPTPLIAALRCYVSSKLGNEVEIPEELR